LLPFILPGPCPTYEEIYHHEGTYFAVVVAADGLTILIFSRPFKSIPIICFVRIPSFFGLVVKPKRTFNLES
jgi:hypothetical protein